MWTLQRIFLRRHIPRFQKRQFAHLPRVVLKNFAKFTGMHMNRSFFSTYNLQLYWKRDASIYSFLWVLRIFLRTTLLWKTFCELNLKTEFYKKWRTDILNLHCEGKCIFDNHLRKVDTELNSNFQLHHRYFFSKVCY